LTASISQVNGARACVRRGMGSKGGRSVDEVMKQAYNKKKAAPERPAFCGAKALRAFWRD
jgi:hypothetical protein